MHAQFPVAVVIPKCLTIRSALTIKLFLNNSQLEPLIGLAKLSAVIFSFRRETGIGRNLRLLTFRPE